MKAIHAAPVLLLFLAACQGGSEPGAQSTETPEIAPAPVEWIGSYADTLPCADCPGIYTMLELRHDSTYVLREEYLERDSIPYGTIGTWTVDGNKLILRTSEAPMYWVKDGERLQRLDADGNRIDSPLSYSLAPYDFHPGIPLRLTGGYVYYADSHSFKPCGSSFGYPVAMDAAGTEGAGLELERTYMKLVKNAPQPLYVEVVATFQSGPAMEGDAMEEYLHMERLVQVLDVQACR
ncbi:MAG TPA: copper resistance protein NlpE N-terminal domain-containing protein [Flavobacteriales bacterium]|nr:copper resistance protein NlpE N-terminal domain-containing protein [Flavobacteriales bacterium]